MKKHLYILTLSLFSCFPFTYQEMQVPFLLPESVVVREKQTIEDGISTLTKYSLKGNYSLTQLSDFPVYAMGKRGWNVVAWHRANSKEMKNISLFLDTNFEFISNSTRERVNFLLENGTLISYFHSNLEANFKNNRGYPKGFNTAIWIDLCVLDYEKNELFYLSYGKF